MKARIVKIIRGDPEMRIRFISNRQNLIEEQVLRNEGLKPVMLDRLDMYWIDITISDNHVGTVSIDPSLSDPALFTVAWQLTELDENDMMELKNMVIGYFTDTSEYKKQVGWIKNLLSAGYGQGSSKPCEICNAFFKVQGKHMHRIYDGKTYPFHPGDLLASGQEILDERGVSTGMSEKEWRKQHEGGKET